MSWSDIDWGNAPSWGALVAATVGASLALGAYRREGQRDQVNQRIRLQDQAAKVGAWSPGWSDGGEIRVRCLNRSDLPVTNVAAGLSFQLRSDAPSEAKDKMPKAPVHAFDLWDPGYDQTIIWNVSPEYVKHYEFEAFCLFMDAQGAVWQRDSKGLELANGEEQPSWIQTFLEAANNVALTLGPVTISISLFEGLMRHLQKRNHRRR